MKSKKPASPRKAARKAESSAPETPAPSAKPSPPPPAVAAKAKVPAPAPAPPAAPTAEAAAKAKKPLASTPISTPASKAKTSAPPVTPTKPAVAAPPPPASKAKAPATAAAPPVLAPAPAGKAKVSPARPAPAVPKKAAAPEVKIPPILLEGDAPAAPAPGGPGQRYALGPKPPSPPAAPPGVELPEAYGTQQLYLTARDPHWLYAHWDMTREQIKKYNSLSVDGHLVLRIHRDHLGGEPLSQIHLHPESRNWFAPVPHAAAKYLADLGYYDAKHKWVSAARSGATLTPPESLSEDTSVRFATIPPEVPFAELLAMVKTALREHVPLVEALQQLRASGVKNLPSPAQIREEWTPAQENALAEIVSIDQVRRVWIGSLEITELIRRQLQQHVSSAGAALFSLPSSALGVPSSVSSPFGGPGRQRGFWFNVNAELIIYGATEPDATVTIGDRKIQLRPDGSFSFRFALPDGNYSLPAAAHSADGEETRRAGLSFSRNTTYAGDVGVHPQDKSLKPPLVSAVA
ncbi:MAG: DUF4912 domain-containing protein [Limisphaerales bacterium]